MKLTDIKESLSLNLDEVLGLSPHVASFCAFLVSDYFEVFDRQLESIRDSGSVCQYGNASSIGFLLQARSEESALAEKFRQEIENLSGRTYFSPAKAPRFEIDGVALLGVVLGMRKLGFLEAEFEWIQNILNQAANVLEEKLIDHKLIQAASCLANDNVESIADPLIRVGLMSSLGLYADDRDRQLAWEKCIVIAGEEDMVLACLKRSVFDCCALALSHMPVNGAGIQELVSILINLTNSMAHWTFENKSRTGGSDSPARQWHIDHEYHVQNLLWTVLKPVFADLVDEEYLPKLAQKHSRFDLGVPSLGLIVEVKFMKRSGAAACRKLIDEITSDHSLYLRSDTGYKKMVVFVWDNCRQTEHYSELVTGLETLDGLAKVIILSRPSHMGET